MADDSAEKELRALCKLFIGGIPRSITDEQLAEAFLQYTDDDSLNDCVVIKDEMKNSRGFGFVTYNKLSDTDTCLANRPHTLGGKEVEVKHAIPRDEQNPTNHTRTNKIFLGGFPREAEEEDARSAIEDYILGVGESLNVKVDKVDIIKKDGEPRGFCFVEMASEDDADKVVIVKHFVIKGKRVELKKAEPKGQKGFSQMGGRGGGGRGRSSSRGGGGGGGRNMQSSFGGGGGWGTGYGGGGGYDTSMYGGSSYGGYGYGNDQGYTLSQYAAAAGGYGGDYGGLYGAQQSSNFGPSRTSNGRYGGAGGGGRGGGRGGAGYRPY